MEAEKKQKLTERRNSLIASFEESQIATKWRKYIDVKEEEEKKREKTNFIKIQKRTN